MAVIRRAHRKWASNLDMYRKVPLDLLEGTKRGSIISYLAVFTMIILFTFETISFFGIGGSLSSQLKTDVALDSNRDNKVRVNFNITMMDLKCEHAVIDMVSTLGTAQNVTSHVNKYSLDSKGVKDRYKGRNTLQNDILHHDPLVTETIEELHEDGEDATTLDREHLAHAIENHMYVFVDFFASWCSHCRDLAPTWETLAEAMTEAAIDKVDETFHHDKDMDHEFTEDSYDEAVQLQLPVFIAKVDCVDHQDLCFQNQIRAYPTLRMYVEGNHVGDYMGDRTVLEMIHWLSTVEEWHKERVGSDAYGILAADAIAREVLDVKQTREEMIQAPERMNDDHKDWAEKIKRHRTRMQANHEWREEDHPGCQLSGFLWVDRVPGNFHIQARSPSHDIAAHMTNVSHEIHHLSFGEPGVSEKIQNGKFVIPPKFEQTLAPLDGNVYVNYNKHEAFHHYLKVVTTEFDDPYLKKKRKSGIVAYQMLSSSQLSYYQQDIVPEAKFSYDPSPIAVHHRNSSDKHWYDYITSIMAIIGGTFTVIGMIENSIHAAMKKRK